MPRSLVLMAMSAACQPMMAGPLPLPLGADTVSTIELSAASPRADSLRSSPPSALEDPPVPQIQVAAASSFALTDRVEAGPAFLLDLEPRGEPGVVTGGLFVRAWTTPEDADILAAVRIEAGWAWLGLGLDLVMPVTDEVFVTLAPTAQATPSMLSGRIPVGAYLRAEPIDLGIEIGMTGGVGFARADGTALVPWLGVRARLSL